MIKKDDINKEKPVNPPKKADFQGQQLDIFRSFLCNGEKEREFGYEGYQGMLELVRQLALTIESPVWKLVREPAPWKIPSPLAPLFKGEGYFT